MSDDTRCDWCLRRLAPEEWESATTDEQQNNYCWGPGDALCDEIHGEEWKRLRSWQLDAAEELRAAQHVGHWIGVKQPQFIRFCAACGFREGMPHADYCGIARLLREVTNV